MLPVLAYEKNQMATTRTQQMAAVNFKRSKASLIRFDLNEQMQVWAELTGGGDSQVVRALTPSRYTTQVVAWISDYVLPRVA